MPDKCADFLEHFHQYRDAIASSEGCMHLELWKDHDQENVFMTYSWWKNNDSLNSYRKSDLFREVWTQTKQWFADSPQAFSAERMEIHT